MISASTNTDFTALIGASDKIRFFSWIYCPHDFITIDELLDMKDEYQIPSTLILRKIISDLQSKKMSENDIIIFLKNNILGTYNEYELKDVIQKCQNMITHDLTNINIGHITRLSNKFTNIKSITEKQKNNEKKKHIGLPHPDINLGRPKLEWKKCYHLNCHKQFTSTDELKTHLEQLDALKHNNHKFHEDYVLINNLTPEKVFQRKLT